MNYKAMILAVSVTFSHSLPAQESSPVPWWRTKTALIAAGVVVTGILIGGAAMIKMRQELRVLAYRMGDFEYRHNSAITRQEWNGQQAKIAECQTALRNLRNDFEEFRNECGEYDDAVDVLESHVGLIENFLVRIHDDGVKQFKKGTISPLRKKSSNIPMPQGEGSYGVDGAAAGNSDDGRRSVIIHDDHSL